jgi:hypothetical protein
LCCLLFTCNGEPLSSCKKAPHCARLAAVLRCDRCNRLPGVLCRDLYGKTSERVLGQLWQTLLLNLIYGFTSARIDNW